LLLDIVLIDMITLPDATLQHRPELDAIVVRWSNESSEASMVQVYAELLDKAKLKNCYKWLLDVRRRDKVEESFTNWFYKIFLEEICAQEVHTTLKISFLVSPTRALVIKELNWQPYLKHYDSHSCYVSAFVNEADAYQWLGIR